MTALDLLASLAQWAEGAVARFGYAGIFAGMLLESTAFPLPAEAVLPFAGDLVRKGDLIGVLAFLAALLGSLAGSLISYAIGYFGLLPLLERYGKYVFLREGDIEKAQRFFERRQAGLAIVVARFVPVVRHLISFPAGSSRMPLVPFLVATAIGAGIYNGVLLLAGYALGEEWPTITAYFHTIEIAVAVVLALLVIVGAFVWWRRRSGSSRAPTEPRSS